MYEDILLPYDGSDGAAALVHHAAEIAHWADAAVHVLFVADTTRDSVTVVEGRTVDVLVSEGEDVVAEAKETLASLGIDARTDVVQGDPAQTIAVYAEEYDMDLVVMPTHGREGVSRYLLGSVTEKVVRLSAVPVLTARMRPDERLDFPYEEVLVPTDGSPEATAAAEYGLSLAAALDATVHVLSVVEDDVLDVLSTGSDETDEAASEAIDAVVSAAESDDFGGVERHLDQGDPTEAILDCLEAHDIDAVVIGTTGRRGTDRILLGSVAENTVRSAPVPVVTVRDRS